VGDITITAHRERELFSGGGTLVQLLCICTVTHFVGWHKSVLFIIQTHEIHRFVDTSGIDSAIDTAMMHILGLCLMLWNNLVSTIGGTFRQDGIFWE
jgi:hypothetical protein